MNHANRPLWRHKKRGTVYAEIARGCFQTADAPALDDQMVVIYQLANGSGVIWVRPAYEFEDGRFERVAPE